MDNQPRSAIMRAHFLSSSSNQVSNTSSSPPPNLPAPTQNSRPWRETLVDVFALNSFSYLVSLPIEIVIAGMSWQEHFQVRLVALLLNTLVARPFGLWRNAIFRRLNVKENDRFYKVYMADTLVFLSFQLPLYLGNALIGGADWPEILKAATTITVISGLLGRPYGWYLDGLRARTGLKTSFVSG